MPKGQQELPPSEHHFRWLLYVSAILVAIGIGFLLYVQLTQPKVFDETYAKQLLLQHDPSLAQETFWPQLARDSTGDLHTDLKVTRLLSDNSSLFSIKEAIITKDPERDNMTLRASYALFGPKPLPLGIDRSWSCPFGTYFNISTETTDRYYFIGVTSNYLSVLLINDFLTSRPGRLAEGFDRSAAYSPNETWLPPAYYNGTYQGEQVNWNFILEQAKQADVSNVWYYNPDDRERYELQLSELLGNTEACTEVTG